MRLSYYILAPTMIITLHSSCLFAEDASSHKGSVDNFSNLFQKAKPKLSCELDVKEKYVFYDIDGASMRDLQRQMKKYGTKWKDGKDYAAVTSWDIQYSYHVFHEDGRCSVKSVRTDVEIVYHLPRWISATPGSELNELWDKYLVHLKYHELGHKDIAVKTAAKINEILVSLASFSSQIELDQEASRRIEEKFRQLKEDQVLYDNETRHGETQGAALSAH